MDPPPLDVSSNSSGLDAEMTGEFLEPALRRRSHQLIAKGLFKPRSSHLPGNCYSCFSEGQPRHRRD